MTRERRNYTIVYLILILILVTVARTRGLYNTFEVSIFAAYLFILLMGAFQCL